MGSQFTAKENKQEQEKKNTLDSAPSTGFFGDFWGRVGGQPTAALKATD